MGGQFFLGGNKMAVIVFVWFDASCCVRLIWPAMIGCDGLRF